MFVRQPDGKIVGATRFFNVDLKIAGWNTIWYSKKSVQRNWIVTEAKLLFAEASHLRN
jgi:hypothetical protein